MAYEERITKPREIINVVPGVVPGVVGEENIADDAVTSPKIKDSSIRTEDIGAGQVQTEDLAMNSVTDEKIAPDAVTETKIAADAVGSEQIKDGSITTPKVVDGAITTPKIGAAQITADKLAPDVTIGTVGVGGITTEKLADDAVTGPKIAANAVTAGKIASGAVGSGEIATGAVTGAKIQDASITPAKLNAVDSPADGEVPTYNQAQAKLEWKPMAGGITRPLTPPIATDEIGDAQVTPVKLSFTPLSRPLTPPIAAAEIGDAQVTRDKIQANAVTGDKIQDASVTVPKIDAVNTPTDGQVLSYELASGRFKYVTPAAGASGITLLNSNITVYSNSDLLDVDQILDLSAWIPATATGVLVEMQHTGATTDGNDRILLVFGRRTAMDHGYSTLPLQGRYQDLYKDAIVATDSARQIRVFISRGGRFSAVNVWVKGYME